MVSRQARKKRQKVAPRSTVLGPADNIMGWSHNTYIYFLYCSYMMKNIPLSNLILFKINWLAVSLSLELRCRICVIQCKYHLTLGCNQCFSNYFNRSFYAWDLPPGSLPKNPSTPMVGFSGSSYFLLLLWTETDRWMILSIQQHQQQQEQQQQLFVCEKRLKLIGRKKREKSSVQLG